jgi:hypothetical protein
MSLVALETRLVSILSFSVDLQSADGKVLSGARGEHLRQNTSSILSKNAQWHGRPTTFRKTAFKRGKDDDHDEVASGCRDSEDRQSCAAGHAYGGGYPNGRRLRETF